MLKNLLPNIVKETLQDAIQAELDASHAYRHLANQCQRLGLFGAAKWFRKEADDELTHYQRIADYLNDRGTVAVMPPVDAPSQKIGHLGDALMAAYEMEVELGKKYEKWHGTIFPRDPTTGQFLLFYLEKQRTSIGEYGDWLARLNRAGDDRAALLLIDQELGK